MELPCILYVNLDLCLKQLRGITIFRSLQSIEFQLGVHANYASNQVPITVVANPITNNYTCTPISLALGLVVMTAQVIDNRRVDLGCNPIRPTIGPPKIGST